MSESLYFPLIDNGMKLVRASYSACMFGLGVSGALAGRRIVFEPFSHPDPCATMNLATHAFLQSGCDRMVIIDGDHIFQPSDVARLVSHDLPLVSGLYPKKTIEPEWPIMPMNGESPEVLFAEGSQSLIEVRCVPRGFLSVHRSVFETLKTSVPSYRLEDGEVMFRFWESTPGIVSEDFAFCDLWREAGGKVWLDHSIRVFHEGTIIYPFK